MTAPRPEWVLVSDFNLSNFANILKSRTGDAWDIKVAPMDNVVPALMSPGSATASALVWTRPERVAAGFQRALLLDKPEPDEILAEVDAFADMLLSAAELWKNLYVPRWQIAPSLRLGSGVHGLLLRMDHRLVERLSEAANIHVLHSARWSQQAGPGAWSARLWYLTKTPFSNAVFQAAAEDLIACERVAQGDVIKLVVLDLDDTLWGGIVGDEGWENLRLGGHDPNGESFVDFQRTLKALKQRGIMLAIASKNDEATALEAINKHPEMVLRRDDFVAMRIDWNDKAANIADMVRQLNIGLHSVMFIDDNPVERSRVKEFLPEVFVPDWPANKLLYDETLRSLPVFDLDATTTEDTQRTQLYRDEAERARSRATHGDVDSWLRSLETRVKVSRVGDADFARVHQLFGKTNQFNLTTRRPNEKELRDWMAAPAHQLWCFRVSDRFGEAGLTGVLGLDLSDPEKAVISDLILSCRILGRQVEESLMHVACTRALEAGKKLLEAHYVPTARNKPCLEFMQRSGFTKDGETRIFTWHTKDQYACPTTLVLELD